MELASVTLQSTPRSTGSKKSLTNWKLSPKNIIVRNAPSFRMIQRYPSNDFSLNDTNFDNYSSGSESDEDGSDSLQDGFKAVDKTKRGFELTELTRSLSDPALQEKILEMRRSRPRRATTHTTNTNTISLSGLDLHKTSRSTFSKKDDSRGQLPVDVSSSLPSFVCENLKGLSLPDALSSPASASKNKPDGGLLDRKLTRRKGRSSANGSSLLCKDNSCLSFDTKTTLGSTDVDDDDESINNESSLPALPAALNKIDESFSERSTQSAFPGFPNPWEGMEHSATIFKSKEELPSIQAMEKLRQELANSQQDADALRTRLSESLQELARVSEQQQHDQQLASSTSTQLAQLKLNHADSMSQNLAYKKEMDRLNSQLAGNTVQRKDTPTQLEQAKITSTSLVEELKAAQKQLAAQQEEMTLTHGTLKRKRLDEQRSKKLGTWWMNNTVCVCGGTR
jgi:hypothetical protein